MFCFQVVKKSIIIEELQSATFLKKIIITLGLKYNFNQQQTYQHMKSVE